MVFDASGSEVNPATVALFWSMVTFPAVCALGIAVSWSFYWSGRGLVARAVILLPLINVIIGVIAVLCLAAFYGGRFNG